jgi:MFS family permease
MIDQPSTFAATPLANTARQGWITCLSAALFFFYIFTQMLMFNVVGHDVMKELSLSAAGMGALSSAYFWGNVLFLFPAGLILDRFSAKKVLLTAMLTSIIATFVFSLAPGFNIMFLARIFIGLAGAFALITGLKLASHWFVPAKMAFVSGSIITLGFLGGLVSQTPLMLMNNAFGWRHAAQFDGGLGILFLILIAILVKDYPAGYVRAVSAEHTTSLSALWVSIKKAVSNSQNWLFGLYVCLINLPIFILGGAFGIGYLAEAQQLPATQASLVTSMLLIGAMIGSPVLGWVSDKAGARKPTMIFGAIISLLVGLVIMYVPHLSFTMLLLLFLALGFITSTQVIGYPSIAESNTPDVIGAGLSIGSTLIMSGGLLIPIFGWLLDTHMTGKTPMAGDYLFAMWMIPVAFILSLICVSLAKETHCKNITSSS